jgi:hypothetical protein
MNVETILGVVRHVLTFGGGFLASKGVLEAAQVETAVGALVTIIGLVWSVLAKRKAPVA